MATWQRIAERAEAKAAALEHLTKKLVGVLENIEIDKDGDGFICEEYMREVIFPLIDEAKGA